MPSQKGFVKVILLNNLNNIFFLFYNFNMINMINIIIILVLIIFIIYLFTTKEYFNNKCSLLSISKSKSGDNADLNADGAADVNVDPSNPKCVGICINKFTWTRQNLSPINIGEKDKNEKIGTSKSNYSDNEFVTEKCFQCIKNFYKITDLIHQESCSL